MITVTVAINGKVIYARTAVNRIKERGGYECDEGTLIQHDPEDGAVALAKKLLDTITETP